jgi:hypothetical protein
VPVRPTAPLKMTPIRLSAMGSPRSCFSISSLPEAQGGI